MEGSLKGTRDMFRLECSEKAYLKGRRLHLDAREDSWVSVEMAPSVKSLPYKHEDLRS